MTVHAQHGAALMVMLVILVMGTVTLVASSLNSIALNNARNKMTANALAQAKNALIAYAVIYAEMHNGSLQLPGYLPCPDIDSSNGEGSSKLSCGTKNISTLGRLPWKTLSIAPLRDASGECLWYANSGTYKNTSKIDMMNWDNNGLLQVLSSDGAALTGQTPDTAAVAIIFAPGAILFSQNQNRSPDGSSPVCGGNHSASNYLDSDPALAADNATASSTANALSKFYIAGAMTNINDQIVFVTRQDIWNAIKKRNDFAASVASLLSAAQACASQPVSVNFNNSPATESPGMTIGNLKIGRLPKSCRTSPLDNWQDNLLYARCISGNCLTVNGNNCHGVVIFSGERNTAQTRITSTDKNNWGNYLENSSAGNSLAAFTSGATFFSGASVYSNTSPSSDILACIP
jgi:hypothetical protein